MRNCLGREMQCRLKNLFEELSRKELLLRMHHRKQITQGSLPAQINLRKKIVDLIDILN